MKNEIAVSITKKIAEISIILNNSSSQWSSQNIVEN